MDLRTLDAYNRAAHAYSNDWHSQPAPTDMYALLEEFFCPGITADIGCGAGRDTAWLAENGFDPIGYDPSPDLLSEARRLHPTVRFEEASLPRLETISDQSFVNVVCETVIMHLALDLIDGSVRRLLSILEPGGTLYLSWRVTNDVDVRDDAGRLYSAIPDSLVTSALGDAAVLYNEQLESASSKRTTQRVIARK